MSNGYNRIERFVPPDSAVPEDDVKSVFLFVGFGWRIQDAYKYVFSIELKSDPDEAYIEACKEFSRVYPRCCAAVFFKRNAEDNDSQANLYEYFESEYIRSAGHEQQF